MSRMEQDSKDFLQRVLWSILIALAYLFINATIGIAAGWLFFYEYPTLGNYIFYSWFLLSTLGFILLMVKWWKKKFPHG